MDKHTIDLCRRKYALWKLAERMVGKMHEEQGPGELDFTKIPDMGDTRVSFKIEDSKPIYTTRNRG